ncbi:ABC transporter permease [Blautia schinkii]|nr:ABC transporter permease [Blautia schinkii]
MKSLKENGGGFFQKLKGSKYFELSGLVCLIIVYSIIVQTRSGNFLTMGNINNILKEIVVYGILATALTFPLINGTFDLSIESTCALGGTCCALLVTDGLFGIKTNLFMAVVISILICCLVGVVNGLLVSRTKIDPFIVTLGTQTAVRGIVYIVCNNSAVTSLPDSFKYLSSGKVAGVSVSIWILLLDFVLMALVLGKTSYGRKIYAIGGSYLAAYISGINVKRIRFSTYVISAALSCIAGILSTARVGSATPNAASGYATIAISACAIGGVALTGGKGLTIGVFMGALMMGMITNGMNLMFIGSNWQYVVRGCLMVLAVFYAQWFSKISNKATNK